MNITLIYGGRSGEQKINLNSVSKNSRDIEKKHTFN